MNLFQKEIRRVQNPAYGAMLAHALASGYQSTHSTHAAIPLPYIFVAMPCLFSNEMVETILHTKRGLRAVVDKLSSSEAGGSDLVPSISKRAREMRPFTLECISVLVASKLAVIDIASATLVPLREDEVKTRPELPSEADAAHKLGGWLAPLSSFEISSVLKVTF